MENAHSPLDVNSVRILHEAIDRGWIEESAVIELTDRLRSEKTFQENWSMDRWLLEVHGLTQKQTQELRDFTDEATSSMLAKTVFEAEGNAEPSVAIPDLSPDSLKTEALDPSNPIGLTDSPPPLSTVPNSFARYRDLDCLGEGGMGQVYVGTDPEIGRAVAIKVMKSEVGSNPFLNTKFRNEARITGLLEHPNIVPIHEAGISPEGHTYFTMKRVQGETLAQLLADAHHQSTLHHTNLDPTPFLRHLIKACEALSFAHSHEIVHRDLKPENIMIGAFGELLVMDWGLAREISSPESLAKRTDQEIPIDPLRTLDGTVLGTPAYMAPEQAAASLGEIDQQTDIYALGSILYEILTGTPPHRGGPVSEILERVRSGYLEAPRTRAPQAAIPSELEAVVLKAMARKKSDRYPTVKDFQSDIKAYLDTRPLEAATYNPLQLLTKWVRRHRTLCATAVIVTLIAFSLFAFQAWAEHRDLANRFHALLKEAKELRGQPEAIKPLLAQPIFDTQTGLEYRETPEQVAHREEVIRSYLAATQRLRNALLLQPGNQQALKLGLDTWKKIIQLAQGAGNHLLVDFATRHLENYGVSSEEVQEKLEKAEIARTMLLDWRAQRLREIIRDLTRGLSRDNRSDEFPELPLLEDYTYEASGYRDLQTVEILEEDLNRLIEKSRREKDKVTWLQSEQDRAMFSCRVLGRLGLPECVRPLGNWLDVLVDAELAATAAKALCNTRNPDARIHLERTRSRFAENSSASKRIWRYADRIPESDEIVTSSSVKNTLERADTARRQKNFTKAIQLYTLAIQKRPSPEAYNSRGTAYKLQGKNREAIADFSRSIESNPRFFAPYLNRGTVFMNLGYPRQALIDFNRSIEIDSNRAGAYLQRGTLYLSMQRPRKGLADLNRSIQLDPKQVSAYMNRGKIFFGLKQFTEARNDFETVLRIDTDSALGYFWRGCTYQETGQLALSLDDFTHTIELKPRFIQAYFQRAQLYTSQKRWTKAIADYSQVILINPRHPDSYFKRAELYTLLQELPKAIVDYSQVIKISPRHFEAYFNRAVLHSRQKRFHKAIEDHSQAIKLNPGFPNAYQGLGNQYFLLTRFEEALAQYNRALELRPEPEVYVQTLFYRGQTLQRLGRHTEAARDYGQCFKLQPNSPKLKQYEAYIRKYSQK